MTMLEKIQTQARAKAQEIDRVAGAAALGTSTRDYEMTQAAKMPSPETGRAEPVKTSMLPDETSTAIEKQGSALLAEPADTPLKQAEWKVTEGEKKIKDLQGQLQKAYTAPYAMGSGAGVQNTWASPYAPMLQAEQMKEEAATPAGQIKEKIFQANRDQNKAREELFYLRQADTIKGYEDTAAQESAKAGLSAAPGSSLGKTGKVRMLVEGIQRVNNGEADETDRQAVERFSDIQKKTLLSLAGQGDWDGAAKYYAAIERGINADVQREASEKTREMAEEHPVAGGVVNVLSGFAQPLAYGANMAQAGKNMLTGEYEPTDYNSAWFMGAHMAKDTAQGIHTAAEKAGGPVGGFLADTALSVANMGAKMAAGPASLALMGLGAAGDNALDALERGATPEQALITSTVAGAAEILTERLPVDELFHLAKTAPGSAKEFMKNILKTMGSEATQEAITEVVNNLVDQAAMGSKSQFDAYVRELTEGGMSREEAEQTATWQFYAVNVGLAGLGGAIASVIKSGINNGAKLKQYGNQDKPAGQQNANRDLSTTDGIDAGWAGAYDVPEGGSKDTPTLDKKAGRLIKTGWDTEDE